VAERAAERLLRGLLQAALFAQPEPDESEQLRLAVAPGETVDAEVAETVEPVALATTGLLEQRLQYDRSGRLPGPHRPEARGLAARPRRVRDVLRDALLEPVVDVDDRVAAAVGAGERDHVPALVPEHLGPLGAGHGLVVQHHVGADRADRGGV